MLKYIIRGALLVALVMSSSLVFAQRDDAPESPTGTRIAVANRAEGTISLIDMESENIIEIVLEEGSEPMYAQNPYYSDEIWVGDRANNRVLVYDALRLRRIAEIPVGEGVFHMWNNGTLGQMWVVNDIDKTMSVIDLDTKEVLATVAIPDDLRDDYRPHDITATLDSAIVTLLGESDEDNQPGYLVQFSGDTFEEINRLEVGADPHLFHLGFEEDESVYVASQGNNTVLELDPNTLDIRNQLEVPTAHGIWANEELTHLYVTNISSQEEDAIYVIDLDTFEIMATAPSAAPNPHNPMVSLDNTKLFITHSYPDSEFTSIYDIVDGVPTNGRIVETGDIPFGIMLIRDPQVDE